MQDKRDNIEEIYHETGDLLVLLTKTIDKWLHVRTLINQYNYKELNKISDHVETLDVLFQAEKQIREMRNSYYRRLEDASND